MRTGHPQRGGGRSDGGLSRTDWGASAFGAAKSILRTCRKNGVDFFTCAQTALAHILAGQPPPLPLSATNPR
ncbi:MAG: hypothetical protein AB7I48_20970 [Planctomycetaceae bacterium]